MAQYPRREALGKIHQWFTAVAWSVMQVAFEAVQHRVYRARVPCKHPRRRYKIEQVAIGHPAITAMRLCRVPSPCTHDPLCTPRLSKESWPAQFYSRSCACERFGWQPLQRAVRGSLIRAAAGPSDVFVLDLDGVIVDSEPEVRNMTAQYDCADMLRSAVST